MTALSLQIQTDDVVHTRTEEAMQATIDGLRGLLVQAGVDAARLLEKAGIDATENETARRLERLLLEELHHRVKNTLATVIAITSQSLRNAENLDEGRHAVESRLMALGRAHDLLMQAKWAKAKLADVIAAAIEPFDDRNTSRFSVPDTAIQIDAAAVLPLTMTLNELCTNAVKYGALSVSAGRVAITLGLDETSHQFNLTWKESGGPAVGAPGRESFGTRLINRLAQQLHGKAQLRYEPDGVLYQLDVPMTALHAQVH